MNTRPYPGRIVMMGDPDRKGGRHGAAASRRAGRRPRSGRRRLRPGGAPVVRLVPSALSGPDRRAAGRGRQGRIAHVGGLVLVGVGPTAAGSIDACSEKCLEVAAGESASARRRRARTGALGWSNTSAVRPRLPAAGSFAWCAAFVFWGFRRPRTGWGTTTGDPDRRGLEHWRRAQQQGVPRLAAADAVDDPGRHPAGDDPLFNTGGGSGHAVPSQCGGRPPDHRRGQHE